MIVVDDLDRSSRRLVEQVSRAAAGPEIVPETGFRAAGGTGTGLNRIDRIVNRLFRLPVKAHLAPVGQLGRHVEVAALAPRIFHEFRALSPFLIWLEYCDFGEDEQKI